MLASIEAQWERLGRFRYYAFSSFVTVAVLVVMGVLSWNDLVLTAILAALEVSFSFDNALVNATVLGRMKPFWQDMFLTFGLLFAVGVVRFLLPLLVVMGTTGKGFSSVISMALNDPHAYASALDQAHVLVAVAGGAFLAMIFLGFIFSENEVQWIKPLEGPLAKFESKASLLSYGITSAVILIVWSTEDVQRWTIPVTGALSLLAYYLVDRGGNRFETEDEDAENGSADSEVNKLAVAGGGLGMFGYLEFQDAAFSFDGVSGAFAVTSKIFVIMAGLGIGSLFVRSMTVDLTKSGALETFRYLEHGAHWAIGVLAAFIFVETAFDIPSVVTGLIGVCFIAAAFYHSILVNKREARQVIPDKAVDFGSHLSV